MKTIKNFGEKITADDVVGRSVQNKNDLIYLIKKFFLNNNGSVPRACELDKLSKYALQKIWQKNKPEKFMAEDSNARKPAKKR